ncbi:uncharacterized protein Z518_11308 [Rhinocladiella mackenziei CBS 650.93]|uniref:Acyl-CoA dehydrogenase n=1 Tax=Rhinocladiella mackenziei CBS 650.93 TaxID=1442369 RepID=A0A0D2IS71_9EURO|nr:uncharacterized protein Z518_11308 [Rhinocladiella mackenziei CBS 650.93]KIW99569.1 hypothetical protein Z518_11308 [Rhinocladiella mackenziei CBS 650.93]
MSTIRHGFADQMAVDTTIPRIACMEKLESALELRTMSHHHDEMSVLGNEHIPASQKIPVIARPFVSERALKTLDVLERFVEERCIPADKVHERQLGTNLEQRFSTVPPIIEQLKLEARKLGLWNMFLPKAHFTEGAGFSCLEFGLMAEYLGKSTVASEATNCAAPDTGNMEVLAKYGTPEQKQRWLAPLLEGQIRSAFVMTEPGVASSDATNIRFSIRRDGDSYVLNGEKWWSSGAPDPRSSLYILMGKSDPSNPNPYRQQSILLVPANSPGITIKRTLSLPVSSVVLGEGRGFEVMQGRLGPGRIHHAMRAVGNAERALEYFVARICDPKKKPFQKLLSEHGIMLERIARSRVEIDAARLAVLNAAIKIDTVNAKGALKEISEVKIQTPAMVSRVADWAIQSFGAAGVCQDTPLPEIWVAGGVMRIAQNAVARELLAQHGMNDEDHLQLNRSSGQSKL